VDTVYKTAEVVASSHKCVLGQRPIWDWRFDQFYWIDVYESKIIQTDQNLQNEVHYQFSEGVTNLKLKSAEEYILTTYDSIYLWNKKKNQKELLKKLITSAKMKGSMIAPLTPPATFGFHPCTRRRRSPQEKLFVIQEIWRSWRWMIIILSPTDRSLIMRKMWDTLQTLFRELFISFN